MPNYGATDNSIGPSYPGPTLPSHSPGPYGVLCLAVLHHIMHVLGLCLVNLTSVIILGLAPNEQQNERLTARSA